MDWLYTPYMHRPTSLSEQYIHRYILYSTRSTHRRSLHIRKNRAQDYFSRKRTFHIGELFAQGVFLHGRNPQILVKR
jgi:hypothetical protein